MAAVAEDVWGHDGPRRLASAGDDGSNGDVGSVAGRRGGRGGHRRHASAGWAHVGSRGEGHRRQASSASGSGGSAIAGVRAGAGAAGEGKREGRGHARNSSMGSISDFLSPLHSPHNPNATHAMWTEWKSRKRVRGAKCRDYGIGYRIKVWDLERSHCATLSGNF